MLDSGNFETRDEVDFRLDVIRGTDAIEIFLAEVGGIGNRDEWLNKARERTRKVNDDLKGWAD